MKAYAQWRRVYELPAVDKHCRSYLDRTTNAFLKNVKLFQKSKKSIFPHKFLRGNSKTENTDTSVTQYRYMTLYCNVMVVRSDGLL